MNALFLLGETLKEFDGISIKIMAQKKALERLGIKVALSDIKAGENKFTGRYVDGKIIDKYSNINPIGKIQARVKYSNLYQYIVANEIQLVYVRYIHFANPFFISFLKKLKKHGIKVLLEIPTYPYDQEYMNLKLISRMVMLIEKISRQQFKHYVTKIITVTPHPIIFGTQAIEISNGVDAVSIPMVEKRVPDNELHLIGVGSISYWHGFDRVIEGLHHYYHQLHGEKKIFFHIVGDSENPESIRYKKLVNEYDLTDHVLFYGRRTGQELTLIFNQADVGVGSLACHRISIKDVKSLKNREYCARGLPFFYSETDVDFEGKDFIFKVPANENPIDIDQIIQFIEGNKFDRVKIRNYAIENLTWERQFEKVMAVACPEFTAKPLSRQDDKKSFESQAIHRDEPVQEEKK